MLQCNNKIISNDHGTVAQLYLMRVAKRMTEHEH